ncbi:MAG: type II toxin-antitoxin system RelE/ParE family toxin [Rhodospirillales bacterium]|nr:type II toxin-antitoxin system RelE/ParE family toxin [Rhodospirillales bacterium]
MTEIVYKRSAARILRRMDRNTGERILAALERLAEDPQRDDLDVKVLEGTKGLRLRVGKWRVLFEWHHGQEDIELLVQAIRPRGEAYKQRKRR